MDYQLTQVADADLEGIYEYSYLTFGEAQADLYLQDFIAAFDAMCQFPKLGQVFYSAADQTEYRRLVVNSHSVFYVVQTERVLIVRVMHGRMQFRIDQLFFD